MACIFLTDEDKRQIMAEIKKNSGGTVTDEQIAAAVEAYLAENPIQGGELTADSITEALGYFPADNIDLEGLEERHNNLVMEVSGKLDASDLPNAVSTALEQAKESGEFDGADGAAGKDGADGSDGADGVSITSVKQTTTSTADGGKNVVTVTLSNGQTSTFEVKNGSKGSTGAAGKDGSAGADGKNGADGNGIKSAVLNANYTLTLTFTDGTSYTTPSIRGATGATGATGAAGSNGKDGSNGTSVTVSSVNESNADGGSNVVTFSDGTTLTIKNGSKGSTGAQGPQGPAGTDASVTANSIQSALGYTPADFAEVNRISTTVTNQQNEIDGKQPKGDYVKTVNGQKPDASGNVTVTAQAEQPNFVDSIDEMTDTEKAYVMKTDGMIYTYSKKTTVVPGSNHNVFDKAAAVINSRYSTSTGQITSTTNGSKGSFITDFIELTNWANLSAYMVRVNFEVQSLNMDANQVYFYDASKNYLGYNSLHVNLNAVTVGSGKTSIDLKQYHTNASNVYVKLRLYKKVSGTALVESDLNDVEILFDANQTQDSVVDTWGWYSTGLSYSQSDNEERIASLENNVNDNTVKVTLLDKRVTNLETDNGTLFIPEWWEDEVADTVAKIKALQAGKNCVTFPFFSDNHQRNGYAGVLIARVMKECGIPYAFYGGDAISSGFIPDEATMIAQDRAFDACMSYIPDGRFCRAVGNHDGFWKVSSTESYCYTREQVYDLFLREEGTAQNKHFGEDGTYYYVNDNVSKVRWIVLNIHSVDVDATQIAWFRDTALHFDESGWAVVIISHAPITRHYATLVYNADEVRAVLKDYINSSSANKADVVGWWTGHVHRDRIFEGVAANPGYDGSTNTEEDMVNGDPIAEVLPWKTVTIISDNVYIGYGGVKHTIDESDQSHAIDFVTINKGTKTVNITRLGFGSDRSFTY